MPGLSETLTTGPSAVPVGKGVTVAFRPCRAAATVALNAAAPMATKLPRERTSIADVRSGNEVDVHAAVGRRPQRPRLHVAAGRCEANRVHHRFLRVGRLVGRQVDHGRRYARRRHARGAARLAETVQRLVQIDPHPAGGESLAAAEPAHRGGHGGPAQLDVAGELGPGGHGAVDLDHGGRHPGGQVSGLQDAHDVRRLVVRGQATQRDRRHVPEQSVEQQPVGLEVEPLDVEEPAVRRFP